MLYVFQFSKSAKTAKLPSPLTYIFKPLNPLNCYQLPQICYAHTPPGDQRRETDKRSEKGYVNIQEM